MRYREKSRTASGLPSKPLTADSVAADFGAKSEVAREGAGIFFDALQAAGSSPAAAARRQWTTTLRATFGRDLRRLEQGLDALAAAYGTDAGRDPLALLFAVQTCYVLVVKLLVWHVVACVQRSGSLLPMIRGDVGSDRLRRLVQALESDCGGLGGTRFQRAGHARNVPHDPYAWYLSAWSEPIARWLRRAAEVWQRYDFRSAAEEPHRAGDLLQGLYQATFPKRLRHLLGEYYTPGWLVEQMLDEVGYAPDATTRLLDPACGSGAFLVSAIRRLRARWAKSEGRTEASREALCRAILAGVVGIDLNPLAVVTARANYLIAISDLVPATRGADVPVFAGDSILGRHEGLCDFRQRFDYVVGNPPWIAWDDLPPRERESTKPLWRDYGLFTLSASDARHGGGKKDLSMLMIYAAADRYLKPSGRLAMVLTQTVFQTRGAGDGFRRFRLGKEGAWLKVLRVNDLVEARPFAAANWTATLVLEKGRPTTYPVPYVKYAADHTPCNFEASPVDPERPTSPWMLWPNGQRRTAAALVGPSDYKAHLGANTGGANGVYWVTLRGRESFSVSAASSRSGSDLLPPTRTKTPDPLVPPREVICVRNIPERGKRRAAAVERLVESELLYPLLRWGDIDRFCAVPSAHLLLVQDVHTRRGIAEPLMRQRYPNAYGYLSQFRDLLERRAAYRRYQAQAAFYSMYDIGPYTLAPIKVVWRRMDRRINAAVVEPVDDPRLGPRRVIPQETCVLVAVDSPGEAHYLCAVLNSALVGFLAASHNVRGGKSFGSPGTLDFLPIRRYEPADPIHRELAEASREAHRLAASGEDGTMVQDRIDRLAAGLLECDDSSRL